MNIIITENQVSTLIQNLQPKSEDIHIWINPDNEIINVDDHLRYIRKIFNDREYDQDVIFKLAHKNGWTSIHYYQQDEEKDAEITIGAWDDARAANALKLIYSRFIKGSDKKHITISIWKPYDDYSFSTHNSAEVFKLKTYINNHTHGDLNEQTNPYHNYSAWITPDNRIIKVMDHLSFIADEMGCNMDIDIDNDKSDDELTRDYEDARITCYENAFKQGWVRMVYEYHPSARKNEIMIEGQDQNTIIRVIKIALKHLIFNSTSLLIDIVDHSRYFTFDLDNDKDSHKYRLFMSGKIS